MRSTPLTLFTQYPTLLDQDNNSTENIDYVKYQDFMLLCMVSLMTNEEWFQ